MDLYALSRSVALLGLASLMASCSSAPAASDAGGANPADSNTAATADTGAPDTGSPDAGPVDRDRDGDGAPGSRDCDDADPQRYPGNIEQCNGIDEDCDPQTLGPDRDMDGAPATTCCNPQSGATTPLCGTDCDDTRATVNASGVEACDLLDNDCDAMIDEGVQETFYRDADGDGFGLLDMVQRACTQPMGYTQTPGDCNDSNNGINTGATESCLTAYDDNCDGMTNETCICAVGANVPCPGAMGVCAGGQATCIDGISYSACSVAATMERCNTVDDDCDGMTDEGTKITCYPDADNDGFAAAGAMSVEVCPTATGDCPMDTTSRAPGSSPDCCPSDANAFPGQTSYFAVRSTCNSFDYDCSGSVAQRYNYGAFSPSTCSNATGPGSCSNRDDTVRANPVWIGANPGCGGAANVVTRCSWTGVVCINNASTATQTCH